jgi:hypothetical protein
MSGGMVPPSVPPVKASSPNYCPSPSKPFACHTSWKSLKFSTSSDAATTYREFVPSCANSFTHISFADPHPLNSVVSYRYKNSGAWVSVVKSAAHLDSILDRANSFALNSFADPHPLNPYGSILYKDGGREGPPLVGISSSSNGNADLPIGALASKSSDISSSSSNFPNSPEDSS